MKLFSACQLGLLLVPYDMKKKAGLWLFSLKTWEKHECQDWRLPILADNRLKTEINEILISAGTNIPAFG